MGDSSYGYKILSEVSQATGLTEHDVWRIDNSDDSHKGSELIVSYAFKHQAKEVAEVLNKWAAAEV